MTLSEALDRARRERMGEQPIEQFVPTAAPSRLGSLCAQCNSVGFPEMVDLVRGTVDMVCPSCAHEWVADRALVPTA